MGAGGTDGGDGGGGGGGVCVWFWGGGVQAGAGGPVGGGEARPPPPRRKPRPRRSAPSPRPGTPAAAAATATTRARAAASAVHPCARVRACVWEISVGKHTVADKSNNLTRARQRRGRNACDLRSRLVPKKMHLIQRKQSIKAIHPEISTAILKEELAGEMQSILVDEIAPRARASITPKRHFGA